MRITGAAKVAGVVGWPVAHSLSPLIHNAWIEALGLNAAYVPFAVPPERFAAFVEGAQAVLVGLNVTVPHKTAASDLATERSGRAVASGSVNLLRLDQGSLFGDSTDGRGLLEALTSAWDRSGVAVVLGAGGAARAAVAALLEAGATEVRVAARRREAAEGLARAFRGQYVTGHGLDQLPAILSDVSLVVNATSAGLNGQGRLAPLEGLPRGAVVMDMVYQPLRTSFLQDAEARGHVTVDGLAMLIGQARPSFEAFFGVAPPPAKVVDVRALCLAALGETA